MRRTGLCRAIFVLLCVCLAVSFVIHGRLFRVMMKYMTVSAFKRRQLAPSAEFSGDNKVDTDIKEHLFCLSLWRCLSLVDSLSVSLSGLLCAQPSAALYYFNKLPCMRRAVVRVWCSYLPLLLVLRPLPFSHSPSLFPPPCSLSFFPLLYSKLTITWRLMEKRHLQFDSS